MRPAPVFKHFEEWSLEFCWAQALADVPHLIVRPTDQSTGLFIKEKVLLFVLAPDYSFTQVYTSSGMVGTEIYCEKVRTLKPPFTLVLHSY